MPQFSCPYLKSQVELTLEREQHIAEKHPDLLPTYRAQIIETLADPDQIRQSPRFGNALLFARWCDIVHGGKFVVVVVVVTTERNWIVTAYIARKLTAGEILWQRS